MSFKTWLSVITIVLVLIVLYASRNEITTSWNLLGQVNLWILSLLIPLQVFSYYAVGEMMFEYLRKKGELKGVNKFEMARMALELNFVNHALPSGGVSGISYMGWRLKQYGISGGRSAMAQVVRFAVTFVAYLVLLVVAVIAITVDGSVNRFTILISSTLASSIVFMAIFSVYIIGSESRLRGFAQGLTQLINSIGKNVIRRKTQLIKEDKIENFFMELHKDYIELRADLGLLKRPLIWAFVFNITDVAMFAVAFWSLGVFVNPAMLLIAYGIAAIAGLIVITPGGAGVYEVLMFTFLAAAGAPPGASIAAILLARVILILGTFASGYVFYQLSILKYGKTPPDLDERKPD